MVLLLPQLLDGCNGRGRWRRRRYRYTRWTTAAATIIITRLIALQCVLGAETFQIGCQHTEFTKCQAIHVLIAVAGIATTTRKQFGRLKHFVDCRKKIRKQTNKSVTISQSWISMRNFCTSLFFLSLLFWSRWTQIYILNTHFVFRLDWISILRIARANVRQALCYIWLLRAMRTMLLCKYSKKKRMIKTLDWWWFAVWKVPCEIAYVSK